MQLQDQGGGSVPFLASERPNAALLPEHRLFAPMIGSWDLDVEWLEEGSIVRTEKGEWHFSWVLDGRAVQDVWIVPALEKRRPGQYGYEYGTSVRFYDPDIDAWRSVWIGPVRRSIEVFVARPDGDEIVLSTVRGDGHAMRWIFSEVSGDAFLWRNLVERGGQWDMVQRFRAKRRDRRGRQA